MQEVQEEDLRVPLQALSPRSPEEATRQEVHPSQEATASNVLGRDLQQVQGEVLCPEAHSGWAAGGLGGRFSGVGGLERMEPGGRSPEDQLYEAGWGWWAHETQDGVLAQNVQDLNRADHDEEDTEETREEQVDSIQNCKNDAKWWKTTGKIN